MSSFRSGRLTEIKDVRGNACCEESCTDPMTRPQGGMSRDKLIQIPDKWMELMLGENPLFFRTKQNCNKKKTQLKKKNKKKTATENTKWPNKMHIYQNNGGLQGLTTQQY